MEIPAVLRVSWSWIRPETGIPVLELFGMDGNKKTARDTDWSPPPLPTFNASAILNTKRSNGGEAYTTWAKPRMEVALTVG